MKNNYLYKGELILNQTYEDNLKNYNSIFVCPYNINNMAKFPFIQFLLIKNFFELELIEIPIFDTKNPDDLFHFSKRFLFNLLISCDNRNYYNEIDFKGIYECNKNLYLFFDITKCELNLNDIYLSNTLWLTLIDEIVNHKHLCNIKIKNNISNFFIQNDSFCFLLNNEHENESYEIPIVGFIDKEEKKLNFTYIFGESRSYMNSIFGPFYYFTNYYKAFENSYKIEETKCCEGKNGLVRFALFTGNTKYIENHPNDTIDNSTIKLDRLNAIQKEYNEEILTMRITDYDGKWSKNNYDSVYLGNIELDNGTFMNKPMIVLKEFNQQQPLSYHYIDKKSYKEKKEYLIS